MESLKVPKKTNENLIQPPVDRNGYSDRTAWILAGCSRLAYLDQQVPQLKTELAAFGLTLKNQFICKKSNNSAYLAVHKTFAVLAFKGTVPKEWGTVETDLNFWLVQTRYGEVHQGFLDAYKELAEQIAPALRKIKVPVYVTGHSLGGALSLLASIFLSDRQKLAACYNYGCPRVGNDSFVDRIFKVPVYRCFHHVDIVPGVPFLFMGYRAYGDVRYLSDDNKLCEGSEAVYHRWRAYLNPFSWLSLIADHSIEKYERILREYAISRNGGQS